MSDRTNTLVLVRHGQSIWNRLNLFSGWADVELTEEGRRQAMRAGRVLCEAGYDFDLCFTSYLKRSINTLDTILEQMGRSWLPVMRSWRLNERHCGALQGLDKAKVTGGRRVAGRRAYDVRPPLLDPGDERDPYLQAAYRDVPADEIPMGESLWDVEMRVWPYFEQEVAPRVLAGGRVLLVAHENLLRVLIGRLEGLDRERAVRIEIPNARPIAYELAGDLSVVRRQLV